MKSKNDTKRWKKLCIFTVFVAVFVCSVMLVYLIVDYAERDTQLWGAEYCVSDVLYCVPNSKYTADAFKEICITADYCLYLKSEDEWQFIGKLEPCSVGEDELSEYFASEDGWQKHYRIHKPTDSYVTAEEEMGFICALQTENGDTLLGFGSDGKHAELLLKLENRFGGTHLSGNFFERSLANTVGGDVNTFHTWTNSDYPEYTVVGFMSDNSEYFEGTHLPATEKPNMGFAVFYHNKDESGYRLLRCQVYENAALAENGIYICDDSAVLSDKDGQEILYDVVIINNSRVEKAVRRFEYSDGTSKEETDSHISGREMLLYSHKNIKEGCRVYQYFYDSFGDLVTYAEISEE